MKAKLSEYLERAARGEIIRVTDRGQPKAILGPLPGRLLLEEGIAEGWIQPGDGSPPATVRRHRATRPLVEVLQEDRGT